MGGGHDRSLLCEFGGMLLRKILKTSLSENAFPGKQTKVSETSKIFPFFLRLGAIF